MVLREDSNYVCLDKAGSGDYKKMEKVNNDFVKELNKRPELASVFSFYSASFPQYMMRIDNDIAQQKGSYNR